MGLTLEYLADPYKSAAIAATFREGDPPACSHYIEDVTIMEVMGGRDVDMRLPTASAVLKARPRQV